MTTKLDIGSRITFLVASCNQVKTGKWPEYVWTGTTPEGAAVDTSTPQQATDRQFAKLKRSALTIIGHTITIERAPNAEDAAKSWWNLWLEFEEHGTDEYDGSPFPPNETGGPPKAQPAPKAPAPAQPLPNVPQAKIAQRAAIRDEYLALFDRVLEHFPKTRISDMPNVQEIQYNAPALTVMQSITATIWLTLKDKGLL